MERQIFMKALAKMGSQNKILCEINRQHGNQAKTQKRLIIET